MLDLSLSLLLLSLCLSFSHHVRILSACASRLMGVTVENPAMGPSGVGIPGRSIVSKRSGSCGCSMRRRSSFAGAVRGKNPVRHGGKPWKTPVGWWLVWGLYYIILTNDSAIYINLWDYWGISHSMLGIPFKSTRHWEKPWENVLGIPWGR